MFSKRTFGGEDRLAIAAVDYHARRFVDAQRGCKAVLELLPDHSNALYLLGLTEVELGNVEAGIALLERAVVQEPGRVDRARGLAAALRKNQKLDSAVDVLGRAVMRAPEDAETFRALIGTSLEWVPPSACCKPLRLATQTPDSRSISVVVCSVDRDKAKRIRAHYETLFAGRRFEIIQIDDARSLCEGYNRGFAASSGDLIVFSHDDIEIVSPDFAARLLWHLTSNDVVGVAGTSRLAGANWNSAGWPRIHGCVAHARRDGSGFILHCFGPPRRASIEALDGLFVAAKRRVCEAVRFDDATFDGFHLYDLDFSYRAFLAGFCIAIAWDLLIIHASDGRLDADWQRYAQRFVSKHGRDRRLSVAPPPVTWPIVQLSERAQVVALHQTLAVAQGGCLGG